MPRNSLIHRIITWASLTLFLAAASGQQVNNQHPANSDNSAKKELAKDERTLPDRPPEIVNLLNETSSQPPEFAADVLIRLAQTSKVRDSAWKREILTEAFRLASKSDQKMKRSYAGAVMDTREGYLALALTTNLDALSLQSRAVAATLAFDKAGAREMFSEISSDQKIPALTCTDALVPDVSDFYAVMKRVAKESFSPDELRDGVVLRFVQPYVQAINSPAQVGPVAKVLSGLDLPPSQFAILLGSFTEALKRTSGDFRTFSFAAF